MLVMLPLPSSLLQLVPQELALSVFTQTGGVTSTMAYPRLHCLVVLPSSVVQHWTRTRQKSPAALLAINTWCNMEQLTSLGHQSTWGH